MDVNLANGAIPTTSSWCCLHAPRCALGKFTWHADSYVFKVSIQASVTVVANVRERKRNLKSTLEEGLLHDERKENAL